MTPNECTDSSTTHSKPLDKCPTCGGAAWDHAAWKVAREREHFARDSERRGLDEDEREARRQAEFLSRVVCVECGGPVEPERHPPAYARPTCFACLPPPAPLPVAPPPAAAPTPPPMPADPVEVAPAAVEPVRGNVGSRRAKTLRALRVAADACARAGHLLATASAALEDVLGVLDE